MERLITAAELEQMPDGDRFELAQGKLVPVSPAGDRHGQAAVILAGELRQHVRKHGLGRVRAETGFHLARDPDTVRGPDVSFVASGRAAGDRSGVGFISGAPDLAIEILSPSNRRAEVARKVKDYLDAGTRLVWVVDLDKRMVNVHRPGEGSRIVGQSEQLEGEDVIPGFSYSLADFFAELD